MISERGSMSNSNVEEVKYRADIVDVIGKVVTLKKAGSNYKGLCPFHSEKTPSFSVSQDKQLFTCFGCGEKGDVIEFVKKYYNLEFREALEKLAEQYGVTLTTLGSAVENKEEYYEINKKAAIFYFKEFRKTGSPGYKYMNARGISDESLHTFGIGYADDSWDSLYNYLLAEGVSKEKMLSLGLISESKGKYFDKFRGRVIFPIKNTAGKVIGFGGRLLGDGNPKYLNSQETPVFHKKNNLYGLFNGKEAIKNEDRAILVEGYMDVIALYDKGVKNVSASLGTALTENQCALLKRFTPNIVLAYDADQAGRKAAMRGIEIINQVGGKGKVLEIPEGKDPDDFISKNGAAAFKALIDKAKSLGDYTLSRLEKEYNLDELEEKVDFVKEVIKTLSQLSPIEQDMYIKKISRDYNISEEAIKKELEDWIEANSKNDRRQNYTDHSSNRNAFGGNSSSWTKGQSSSNNFWNTDNENDGAPWIIDYEDIPENWASDYEENTSSIDEYYDRNYESNSIINTHNFKNVSRIEIELLKIIFSNEDYYDQVLEKENAFKSLEGKEVLENIRKKKNEDREININSLFRDVSRNSQRVLEIIKREGLLKGNEEEVYNECIEKIRIESLKQEEKQLLRQLELLEKDENKKIEDVEDVSKKLMVVQRNLKLRR